MDKLSAEQRRKCMAAIRSKDTKPEMIVRRGLWSRGFRYRLNHKRLPGHPDLVLRKYRTCIFVNGCFWHGHHLNFTSFLAHAQKSPVSGFSAISDGDDGIENSICCKIPKTDREFWVAKIRRNQLRDREEQKRLAQMGWHGITVWEAGEECDDGNNDSGDGCSANCQIEYAFTCTDFSNEPYPESIELPVVYRDFIGRDLPEGTATNNGDGYISADIMSLWEKDNNCKRQARS